jgi:hypothetical protein
VAAAEDAGVVHKDIDTAELFSDAIHHVLDMRHRECCRSAAGFRDGFDHALSTVGVAAVDDRNESSLSGTSLGDGLADALRPPGVDGDLAAEAHDPFFCLICDHLVAMMMPDKASWPNRFAPAQLGSVKHRSNGAHIGGTRRVGFTPLGDHGPLDPLRDPKFI